MLVNSHSTTPRFITLFPTRSDASTDTAIPKPRAKLSPMGEVGMYDGTEPAQRWLMRLEVLFAGANDEEAVDPTHLREIMKRAGKGKAIDADLDDKCPLTFLPEERDKPTNPKLPQGETEVLESYYSRCQSLVVRSGGRDKPLDPLDTLSQAEGYILRDFIFKFVHGLYDKNLMQEAISHSALAVDGLRQAMDVVRRAAVREAIKPQLPSNFKWSQYNRIAEWFQFIRTR
ncbi:hypothetical protein E4U16_002569 [Claviceps sp. LM84 group G4]|nr:hypothetical protein E4U16_002569 [Claviceps sp. LM84 group G4]